MIEHVLVRYFSVMHSSSDIVVSMTCDAMPADELLIENLVKGLNRDGAASCYGNQLPFETSSLQEKFSRAFNYPDEDSEKTLKDIERLGIKAFFCSNVCAAYKRAVFNELGGFPDRTIF